MFFGSEEKPEVQLLQRVALPRFGQAGALDGRHQVLGQADHFQVQGGI
jgi:hypothetical protein